MGGSNICLMSEEHRCLDLHLSTNPTKNEVLCCEQLEADRQTRARSWNAGKLKPDSLAAMLSFIRVAVRYRLYQNKHRPLTARILTPLRLCILPCFETLSRASSLVRILNPGSQVPLKTAISHILRCVVFLFIEIRTIHHWVELSTTDSNHTAVQLLLGVDCESRLSPPFRRRDIHIPYGRCDSPSGDWW
jgi:hypothetical protein